MRKAIAGVALCALASCGDVGIGEFSAFSDSSESVADTSNRDYYPNDQLIVSGKSQFAEGNYGLAYRSFKKAIDVAPEDPQAWLGYAAAADMPRRFAKADFAYRKIQPIVGHRIGTQPRSNVAPRATYAASNSVRASRFLGARHKGRAR